MFDDLKQPEDIFAKTDESAPQVPPPTPSATPAPSVEAAATEPTSAREEVSPGIMQQRMAEMSAQQVKGSGIKVIVIILAIVVIVGGAFMVSWRILTSKTAVTPLPPEPTPFEDEAIVPEETIEEVFVPEEVVSTLDTDQDGLTDAREMELGTDINSSDTDEDGLFDREEVEVYFTDPLNPDTDGDTYLDGAEVQGGYDPNGPGKLLEIPSAS